MMGIMRQSAVVFCIIFSVLGCSLLDAPQSSPEARRDAISDSPLALGLAEPSGALRGRVSILPLIGDRPERSPAMLKKIHKDLERALIKLRRFVVVDARELPVNPADELTDSSDYNFEVLSPLAAQTGLAALIEGRVLEIKIERLADSMGLFKELKARVFAKVRLRAVASDSNRVLVDGIHTAVAESATTAFASRSISQNDPQNDPQLVGEALELAFAKGFRDLVLGIEKLEWRGRVAKVVGERVYVNAGRLSGLQIGDLLKVTEPGEEIFDPERGNLIGRAPGRMKGTLEIVSYFGKDGAIATIHSGTGFAENDLVEIY